MVGGSYLDVQTDADNFCMEPSSIMNESTGKPIPGAKMCPTWAGGTGKQVNTSVTHLDGGWTTRILMAAESLVLTSRFLPTALPSLSISLCSTALHPLPSATPGVSSIAAT
jgi:hypothetical protein